MAGSNLSPIYLVVSNVLSLADLFVFSCVGVVVSFVGVFYSTFHVNISLWLGPVLHFFKNGVLWSFCTGLSGWVVSWVLYAIGGYEDSCGP